jgi:hypothetical protein
MKFSCWFLVWFICRDLRFYSDSVASGVVQVLLLLPAAGGTKFRESEYSRPWWFYKLYLAALDTTLSPTVPLLLHNSILNFVNIYSWRLCLHLKGHKFMNVDNILKSMYMYHFLIWFARCAWEILETTCMEDHAKWSLDLQYAGAFLFLANILYLSVVLYAHFMQSLIYHLAPQSFETADGSYYHCACERLAICILI